MSSAYNEFADVCLKFYELTAESERVASFVTTLLSPYEVKSVLFIGSFLHVAKALDNYSCTIVDYSDEMVAAAHTLLPDSNAQQGDIRALSFQNEFDAVLCIGRVFTHMFTDDDAHTALTSVAAAVRPGGVVLIDNYESDKIELTSYFNGTVRCEDESVSILRNSSTRRISDVPHLVEWHSAYRVRDKQSGQERSFDEQMPHRGFRRDELANMTAQHGLRVLSQGDNFDETSFYTLMQKE